jgi:L-gulonate 5-dehydrogenase
VTGPTTHLAAVTTGPGHVEVRQVAAPPPDDRDVAIEVEAVGLCGTDLHIFDGSFPAPYPVIQGHEFAGTVVDLPDGDTGGLRPGDRVAVEPVVSCGECYACRHGARNTCANMVAIGIHRPGGLQERVRVPLDRCHAVGDLPPETAALVETTSISLHAVTRAQVTAGEQVVVLGAGPIGLGVVLALADLGARALVLDRFPGRLALAADFGAEATVAGLDELGAAVAAWTDGDGAAVVFEATGNPTVAAAAFDVVAPAGRVAIVGVSEQEVVVPLRVFTKKELTVVGSRATRDFPAAVELVRRRRDDVARMISHEFPLGATGDALRFALEHPDEAVKTIVTPRQIE